MTRLVAVLDLNTGQFVNKLEDVERRTGKTSAIMGTAMKAVGAGVLAAGAAVGALGVTAVKSAGDFEEAFANVATLLGEDAPKEIGKLKAGILELDPALGAATDLTKGLYQALSAGVKPAESIKFMEQAAKLAAAGLADVDSTVKVLAGNINAYGEKSLSVAQVSDLLFQTVKSGVVELPELAAGLGQVSGVAAAAGVSQRDLMAAIASVTKAGVPASQAMNSIKAALSNIISPSERARLGVKDMGVAFSVTDLQAKGLAGLLGELAKKTQGNAEQTAQFFGSVEGLNAVLALTRGNLAPFKEDLAAADAAIAANGKVTELAFQQQQETVSKAWERMKNAVNTALIQIGTPALPYIRRAMDLATTYIMSAKDALLEMPGVLREQFGTMVADSKAGLDDLGKRFPWLKDAIGEVAGAFQTLGTGLGQTRERLLADWNAIVLAFRSGSQTARDTFAGISDWLMPGLDGMERFRVVVEGVLGTLKDTILVTQNALDLALTAIETTVGKIRDAIAWISEKAGTVSVVVEQASAGNFRAAASAAGLGTGPVATKSVELGTRVTSGGALDVIPGVGAARAAWQLFGGKPEARAEGGPVGTRNAYLVGERGPELFVPDRSGTILPAGETKALRFAGARAEGGPVAPAPAAAPVAQDAAVTAMPVAVAGGANAPLPGAAYGAGERDGLLPGKALEDLKRRIREAVRGGVTDGVMTGSKEGAGDKKTRKGLWGDLFEAGRGGTAFGTIEGIMSGDVDAASRLFQKGFGKGLAEEAKSMLVKALGKKLLKSIFGGGFGGLFAEGGRPPVGVPSIVGEAGPEVFVPDRPGRVLSHEESREALVPVRNTKPERPDVTPMRDTKPERPDLVPVRTPVLARERVERTERLERIERVLEPAMATAGGVSFTFGDIHLETGTSAQDNARQLAADLMDSIVALVEGGRGDRLIRAMDRRRR